MDQFIFRNSNLQHDFPGLLQPGSHSHPYHMVCSLWLGPRKGYFPCESKTIPNRHGWRVLQQSSVLALVLLRCVARYFDSFPRGIHIWHCNHLKWSTVRHSARRKLHFLRHSCCCQHQSADLIILVHNLDVSMDFWLNSFVLRASNAFLFRNPRIRPVWNLAATVFHVLKLYGVIFLYFLLHHHRRRNADGKRGGASFPKSAEESIRES